ncbi:MAG: hypothetical protein VW258_02040 [Thalassolituus sp.]
MKSAARITSLSLILALSQVSGCHWWDLSSDSESKSKQVEEEVTELTYYIDSVAGDDNNSGLSEEAPWKTLGRFQDITSTKRINLNLKGGSRWHETLTIEKQSDVIIGPYDYTYETLPIIDGSELINHWTPTGTGLYYSDISLDEDEALGNIRENEKMMSFLAWNTDAETTFASAAAGTYAYDYALSRMYIKPETAPAENNYYVSKKLFGISVKDSEQIIIGALEIQGASLHGIQFNNCLSCGAVEVWVHDIGGAVVQGSPELIYAGNGIELANNSLDSAVYYSNISRVFDSCLTAQTFTSNAVIRDMTFMENSVSECGFAGIELSVLSNGTNVGSKLDNLILLNNNAKNIGNSWSGRRYDNEGHGLRIKADKHAGIISTVAVYDLKISHTEGSGVFVAGESSNVSLSEIRTDHNNEHGIAVVDPDATTLSVDIIYSKIYDNAGSGISINTPYATKVKVKSTSFYQNGSLQLSVINAPHILDIQNNIFESLGTGTDLYIQAPAIIESINENCYQTHTNMIGYGEIAYSDLASFTNASGHEADGIAADEAFLVDPESGDFTVKEGSTCTEAGYYN